MDQKRKDFRCPDPECEDGKIIVYNAYSANPLKGEEQNCELCRGVGFFLVEEDGEIN
jgi:hypothetical protein